MRRAYIAISILFATTFVFSSVANAGLVIKESSGEETLISKNMMKSNWEKGTLIMDATKHMIYFVDDTKKMIASNNVDDFCDDMKKMVKSMMEGMPEEQKSMIKKMMGMRKAPKIDIVKKGPGEKISGFKTNRYDVMADGKLYEQLWLSDDKELMKDCQEVIRMVGKFSACMQASSRMGAAMPPETSPEYVKIYEMGMILKSVKKSDTEAGMSQEITSVTKKDIPDSEFSLPKGYKSVPVSTFWGVEQ